ncbi:hypothetical protein Esi_0053_0077 [Ectocarpus siliculosus]|uniref:Uncharacterized protein n=1 Tax=Ectocarpus siliculosus TaxID=2880 RepID=D8LPS8_ECTSI|nr:hypothetical protein Esi_0053_0077 [Ectocarpus siliculosus]|eukprot:CBN77383.1 hypothetical protein Esi_0053_0077 [Ectocarpus siliculosus]
MRWGHSLHTVTREAMEEPWRGDPTRRGRGPAALVTVRHPERKHGRERHQGGRQGGKGSTLLRTAPEVLPDAAAAAAAMKLSVAPAHGGVGDTATGQPVSREMKGSAGTAKVAGRVVTGKGRAGCGSRVARLGSALDNVETRADEARGRSGRGVRASSGQRLNLPCTKRHVKIVRAITVGDASAAAGNGVGGVGGGGGTRGTNGSGPYPCTPKSSSGGKQVNTISPSPALSQATATAATAAPPPSPVSAGVGTAVAVAPIEGAVSLRTVGKTVAFLANLASPSAAGRDGDGGVFGGGGKTAGVSGTGSAYGPRQCWYSAAAAKQISDEAHEGQDSAEEEGQAALELERRLHAPPAIQFVTETRRGGFNKGSTITYGSTITLQAFHGGILCFNNKGKAQASALGAQPNALLTVWNLQDLQSKGPVRYGDVLLLQMGRHEVMGSSLIMHKEPETPGSTHSSKRSGGVGSQASAGGVTGEQQTEDATRNRTSAGSRAGPSKSSSGGSGGSAGGGVGAAVGNPVAVPFRGKNMDKAKHTGRWVIFHKDDPEATQGSEVCHLDRVVLMQTWLSLASDRPADACLKQCGSVDDHCSRQQHQSRSSTAGRERSDGGVSGRGGGGRTGARGDGAGEQRGSRQDVVVAKSVFAVRPECGWVISGVEDSGSGKRTGGGGGAGGRSSSATLLEGAATRQLRRSKSARLITATSVILQMRSNGQSIVRRAQEIFDETQRRRLACLRQKLLRTFRRERSRNWLPKRGGDRQLSIVYGPSSPWGKREALRLQREQHKQFEKVTAKAKIVGDIRNPTPFEVTRAENGALATEAKVKQEVWDALLKRYGYQEVTDMLALMHSASVIRRAVRAMRQRKWTRKMAKIDPEMVEKVERLRKIQEQRKAKMNGGGVSATSSGRGVDSAPSVTNGEDEPRDDHAIAATGPASAGTAGAAAAAAVAAPSAPASVTATADRGAQRPSRPYEALLAGSLEKFEGDHRHGHGGGDGGGSGDATAKASGGSLTRGARGGRPLSSGGKPRFNTIGGRGKDAEREESCREKERQTRAKARPKTAGEGSGGVQGVLARMGGYEKSVFREFGGDGRGGAVDQQLSRDVVLLEDLRGTLTQVMAWDLTQGGAGTDPAAAGSVAAGHGTGGNTQEKGVSPDSSLVDESPVAKNHHAASRLSGVAAVKTNGKDRRASASSSGLEVSERNVGGAGDENLVEHVPVTLAGHHVDGSDEFLRHTGEDPGASPTATRQRSACPRGRRVVGGGGSGAAEDANWSASTSDDAGSTSTAASAASARSCKRRTPPAPLTDDERMSMLQHIRPSVFGEPTAFSQRRRAAVTAARPRSAAAGAVEHSGHRRGIPGGNHHQPPRASTARRTSRRGESDSVYRGSGIGAPKHRGILVHDGWVAGQGEPSSCAFSTSTGATPASESRPRSLTCRRL